VRRRIAASLALLVLGACALAPAAMAGGGAPAKGKTYKVNVRDDYYSPIDARIKRGDSVKWSWGNSNINSHDVTLKKGPKGVKKNDYRSISGAIGITFKRTFTKPGTYSFYCTIHPDLMQMDVVVK
jgi:plastocyanin